jgi:hypothetical protein
MTMQELMNTILEILPNAVFAEENATGEILIATGLVETPSRELVGLDD